MILGSRNGGFTCKTWPFFFSERNDFQRWMEWLISDNRIIYHNLQIMVWKMANHDINHYMVIFQYQYDMESCFRTYHDINHDIHHDKTKYLWLLIILPLPYNDWLVVWNITYFSIYWECHNPNWRTPSFFRGVGIPPTSNDINNHYQPLSTIINQYYQPLSS